MAEGVVVGAEEVDVEVEGFNEFLAEVRVQAYRDLIGDFGDDDQRLVQQGEDVLVLLLIAVLLQFLAHEVVEGDDLVGQVIEEDERPLEGLHLHGVLAVHFGLEPADEFAHWNVQHY